MIITNNKIIFIVIMIIIKLNINNYYNFIVRVFIYFVDKFIIKK